MKKKILMVYPAIPTTYWSFKYVLDFVQKKSLMPPLGLITIASLIPEDKYSLKLVDMNLSPLDPKDIEEADLVMVSAMIVQKGSFKEVVAMCNKHNTPVAAGGPYPTTSYEKINGVDYFILNEGEITLPKFLADYEKGTPQKLYLDPTKPQITETPVPRFDLLDLHAYASMAVQTSRGCPFNCEFCDIIEMFGRVPRYKTPAQFTEELDALYNTGYRGPVFIVDDNFIGNKLKVKELLYEIKVWQDRKNYPFSLFTEASINLSEDEELLDLFVHCGFNMVFIGIETPDKAILKNTQKLQNVKSDMFESVKKIQQKGIEVMAGFILGFDNEPEDIFDLQIEFITKAGIPLAMIGLMMILPNTQLYRRLQKEGRLLKETSGNNTHDLDLNFIPTTPRETLVAGYKRVISELYNLKNYFNRCSTLIKRFPKHTMVSRSLQKGDLKAFFKSLYRQTFSKYGFYYIKYLLTALLYNRWHFAAAVNWAIKGYHFSKITKETIQIDEFANSLASSLTTMKQAIYEIARKYHGSKQLDSLLHKTATRTQKTLKKQYAQLDTHIQQYMKDTFTEHMIKCNTILDESIEHAKNKPGKYTYNKVLISE